MNSPAETHGAILNAIVRRFAAARLLAADEGDPDVLLAALDRALDAARVAVVRPTRESLVAAITEAMKPPRTPPGASVALQILDALERAGFAVAAVVRPTRESLAAVIANGIPGVDGFVFPISLNDLSAADALLAQFDIRERVAVSDSQETPTP